MRRIILEDDRVRSLLKKKVTTNPFPCLTLLCFGSSFQTWSCTCFIVSYCFHRSQENLYIYSGVRWKEVWYVYSMVFHSYKVKLSFFLISSQHWFSIIHLVSFHHLPFPQVRFLAWFSDVHSMFVSSPHSQAAGNFFMRLSYVHWTKRMFD